MTIKSLLNWGGLTKSISIPSDRWHSGWDHEHKYHGHHKGDKGSAALSALALLAFLFLINVMQQSLNEFNTNNSVPNPAGGTAVLLREENVPVVVTNDKNTENLRELKKVEDSKNKGSIMFIKGDTLG
ncbi:uncharacterized protein [Chelonus insularis]|uniref:uncharacterized protein n=1 Tax=Chelonus insularis TaxID=460826 RepID=UPI00158C0678|nr:uncharacterized protein LOC118066664 [Chelonus insularis]